MFAGGTLVASDVGLRWLVPQCALTRGRRSTAIEVEIRGILAVRRFNYMYTNVHVPTVQQFGSSVTSIATRVTRHVPVVAHSISTCA